jgi:hypothetical protein
VFGSTEGLSASPIGVEAVDRLTLGLAPAAPVLLEDPELDVPSTPAEVPPEAALAAGTFCGSVVVVTDVAGVAVVLVDSIVVDVTP